MANRSMGNQQHHNSSISSNLKDKITSKIRDCFAHHYHSHEPVGNNQHCDIDDTVNENNNSADNSVEWHTPCDELPDESQLTINSPLSGVSGPRVYRALYRYKPTRPDELTFEPGDVVVLLQQTPERGWWFGEHQPTGKSGLFPANYVEPFTKSAQKETSATKKPSSETRQQRLAPGRLTALESDIAALRSKVESKPSLEQLKMLEEEIDRLKIVASVVNSPSLTNSPLYRETPVMNHFIQNHPVKQLSSCSQQSSLVSENSQPIVNLSKLPTESIPAGSMSSIGSASKPGQVKVPACFISKTPQNTTPQFQQQKTNSGSKTFKPAGFGVTQLGSGGRASVSPAASLHAVAVRVNAVITPSSPRVVEKNASSSMMMLDEENGDEDESEMETTGLSAVSNSKIDRKASVIAAGKLKRRSITHYKKKCERKFSKLCKFYETLAEGGRLGLVPEHGSDSSATSPSMLSVTTRVEDSSAWPSSLSISDKSSANLPSKSVNCSLDNPFQKSLDTTVKGSPAQGKRFPAFNANVKVASKPNSIANVLLKQQEQSKKVVTVSGDNRSESPSLKNIRRPPMNKLKMGTLSTPQPTHVTSKAHYPRCSSAGASHDVTNVPASGDDNETNASVLDLRRRFETISVSSAVVTNALNSQPKEKRSRKCSTDLVASNGPNTPTSATRRKKSCRVPTPVDGKDSGLGNYPTRQSRAGGDSTVDIFNVAQTTQAIEDANETSCSPAFSTSSSMLVSSKQNATLKPAELNEAGIFDCSLTWTESSSESGVDHERTVRTVTKKTASRSSTSNKPFVRV